MVGTLQSGYEATLSSIGRTSCTKQWCDMEGSRQGTCCNECRRHVVLVGEDGSIVGLTGEECVGDESRLCCTLDVHGQKIIATGVLVDEYGRGQLWFKGPYDICVF